jgi:hypothetical protein
MTSPKRPSPSYGWVEVTEDFRRYLPSSDSLAFQRRGGLRAISSLAPMEAPDGSGDVLPTWLVSVSRRGSSMPSDSDMKAVRCAFGMSEAEEDNHEPGNARKLFLVVDPARRVDCECKAGERLVVREDGYRYSVEEGRA